MIYKQYFPKLGTNITSAEILEWFYNEGDKVSRGDKLLEVETEKSVFEIEADHDGYLRKKLVESGDKVLSNKPLCLITSKPDTDVSGTIDELKEQNVQPNQYQIKVRSEFLNHQPEKLEMGYKITPKARTLIEHNNIELSEFDSITQRKGIINEEVVKKLLNAKRVLLFGANLAIRQSNEILDYYEDYRVIGYLSEDKDHRDKRIYGLPVYVGLDCLNDMWSNEEVDGVILIEHQTTRRIFYEKLKVDLPDIKIFSLIDPRAIVSKSAVLGEGLFIEAGAVVGPGSIIGDNVIIDSGAVISHDCYIGAHSHLSVGCRLAGIVRLEGNVLVSVGASINSTVTIGKNTVISPGSSVMNDLPDNVVVSGVPAAIMGKSKRGM